MPSRVIKNPTLWKTLFAATLIALLATVMLWPQVASAHPLGNFTINHYSRLEIGAKAVKVTYVLDMAEIPTVQDKESLDLNRDGAASEAEKQTYLDRKTAEILANLKLQINNQAVELHRTGADIGFPAGQGGLPTTRLTVWLESDALPSAATSLLYQDNNFSDRLGWKEIVVRNASGVALLKSSVPAKDTSNELRTYPEDLLQSPLQVTTAQTDFKFDPGVMVNPTEAGVTVPAGTPKTNDPFAGIVDFSQELTLPVIIFALLAAIVLGAIHAFSPGHGKTVVGAYLVGSHGTPKHAVFLGLVVTITHTIGVFALGLITLFASQYILPEKLYPWLSFLSGLMVLLLGFSLLYSRLKRVLAGQSAFGHSHSHDEDGHHHDHDDGHDHDHNGIHFHHHHDDEHDHDGHHHDHEHSHPHSHDDDHDHVHTHTPVATPALVMATTASGPDTGLTTSERVQPELVHEHNHTHDHSHTHDHNHKHEQLHMHDHHHDHDHEEHDHEHHHNGLVHSHGGITHSHLPPGMDGNAVTWKRLLLFGISAGLLPCPSALVVMLGAIAVGQVAFGLLLIVFFSFGLAVALTAIGLVLLFANRLLSKMRPGLFGRVLRYVPVASAVLIAVLGVFITYDGLRQLGLIK